MPFSLPNILTLARIAAIPVFVVFYLLFPRDQYYLVVGIFVLAAITDWLDGFLARRMQETSSFGAFLDPVADKLMVCTALVLIVADQTITAKVFSNLSFTVAVIVIVSREVSVVALREWMAEAGQRASLATTFLSKAKTFVQMAAIALLLLKGSIYGQSTLLLGEILLYIAAGLTIWTMVLYLRVAWPVLLEKQ